MTRPPLKNVGASVRARLTDYARQRDENAQRVMLHFAIERLIYRLAQSGYRDHSILKGAMLFSFWAPLPYRSTGDLDLLGQGDPAPDRMAAIWGCCRNGSVGNSARMPAVEFPTTSAELKLVSVLAAGRLRSQLSGLGRIALAVGVCLAFARWRSFPCW
jgi:hypothetical protein